jgi:alcohol dehydrogenase class IV
MVQNLISGSDSINRLAGLIRQRRYQRILVVSGQHAGKKIFSPIIELPGVDLHYYHPQPGLPDSVATHLDWQKIPWNPELIIAFGGGRILDTAKMMIWFGRDQQKPFFIALPTTAGSGSEATPFAVVYEGLEKKSISDPVLLPDLVFLDASLLKNLPSIQRAISGIDALAQAIEALWNRHATEHSDRYALEALSILWNDLEDFVHQPEAVRDKNILWAAHLSGKAIAITRTTGCHALSYYLTANHGISHGQAVAFFLPMFFLFNEKAMAGRGEKIYSQLGVASAAEAFEAIQNLMERCGLAIRFSQTGEKVDVERLLASVNQERFSNNPVPFDPAILNELISQYIY